MTTQLLILGNGFDLHCGLKSDYKEFFYNTILDTIGARFGLQQMRAGVSGFWEALLLEYFKIYGEKNYNWCDIENIIENTLSTICCNDKQLSIREKALESVKSRINPNNSINTINDPIACYLCMYCMKYFYNVLSQQTMLSNEEMFNLLIKHLLQELNNFERRFCKYLKDNIINPQNEKEINEEYIVNAVNLLAKITGFSPKNFQNIKSFMRQEIEECEEIINPNQKIIKPKNVNVLSKEFSKLKYVNILSFNYTNIFDILAVATPCSYNNVHGKLCTPKCKENCNLSNIIFGIDDNIIQSKNENNELRLFSKTYRKMSDTNTPTNILPPNDGSSVAIKFYGHSFSEADYSYFQSIFDYYNLYSNSNVSLIFYYSEGYEQTDAIYRLINVYGKTLSNKEQGKNLTHKLLLENRLKISKIS